MKIETYPSPEEMNGERYFEIRDTDSSGHGAFYHFAVTRETPDQEIYALACEIHTKTMEAKEAMYIPSMFRSAPLWRSTLKVVELSRDISYLEKPDERTGRSYRNNWKTKRKGLKFTISNHYTRIVFSDKTEMTGNCYSFGKLL